MEPTDAHLPATDAENEEPIGASSNESSLEEPNTPPAARRASLQLLTFLPDPPSTVAITMDITSLHTWRYHNAAVTAKAVIMNMYSGGEDSFDPADPTFYDSIPELSEEEQMSLPDFKFTSIHCTTIDQVDKVERNPRTTKT